MLKSENVSRLEKIEDTASTVLFDRLGAIHLRSHRARRGVKEMADFANDSTETGLSRCIRFGELNQHFGCLSPLPCFTAAFTQPGALTLADLCTYIQQMTNIANISEELCSVSLSESPIFIPRSLAGSQPSEMEMRDQSRGGRARNVPRPREFP